MARSYLRPNQNARIEVGYGNSESNDLNCCGKVNGYGGFAGSTLLAPTQHSCHQGPLRIRPCDREGVRFGHIGWRGNRQRCFQTPRFETNFLTSMKPESAALEIGVAALNVRTPVANSGLAVCSRAAEAGGLNVTTVLAPCRSSGWPVAAELVNSPPVSVLFEPGGSTGAISCVGPVRPVSRCEAFERAAAFRQDARLHHHLRHTAVATHCDGQAHRDAFHAINQDFCNPFQASLNANADHDISCRPRRSGTTA